MFRCTMSTCRHASCIDSLIHRCADDVPMCQSADVPMCRSTDVPMCRFADMPMCRCDDFSKFHDSEFIGLKETWGFGGRDPCGILGPPVSFDILAVFWRPRHRSRDPSFFDDLFDIVLVLPFSKFWSQLGPNLGPSWASCQVAPSWLQVGPRCGQDLIFQRFCGMLLNIVMFCGWIFKEFSMIFWGPGTLKMVLLR